ncbi:unnamed protein product [Choristocarpus tenellus]
MTHTSTVRKSHQCMVLLLLSVCLSTWSSNAFVTIPNHRLILTPTLRWPATTSVGTKVRSTVTKPLLPSATEGGIGEESENKEGSGPLTPAGLTLEGVYKRVKIEAQGLEDGAVALDSKDVDYGVEIVKVKMPREPSLGIQLVEVARGADGRGLVLVSGLEPGGRAEVSGKVEIGDTLSWVGVEPNRMIRVEALDWDQTVNALSQYTGDSEITLVLKRLIKREMLDVVFKLPNGDRTEAILAGSNLRGEMIRLGVPVYDPKTKRYDQPYATGNCGGEGICGTCFVEVQQGANLLSPADEEELMLMAQGVLPTRWRLSCKTIVGMNNDSGTVTLKAVPQAEWREAQSQ